MMHKLKVRANHTVYIIFAVLSLFSLTLIFNDNIWFDEAYTLSLIQHNYSDIINILKSDMHPPLYFLSLKTFCCIFGYSITATKIFSAIGYIATLFLGCTIIKKHYGSKTSIIYMLTVGAVPMMLYFSVQQRSYSWSIFFVTLCFIESLLFIANKKFHHCILFAIAGLGAAYNHIYALLAVGIIFAFANIYLLIKDRNLFKRVIIADLIMVAGYSFWIIPLLNQTKSASSRTVVCNCIHIGHSSICTCSYEKEQPKIVYNFRRCLRYGDSNNRVVRNRFYTPVLHCKIQRCNSRYLCNSRCFRRKRYKTKAEQSNMHPALRCKYRLSCCNRIV